MTEKSRLQITIIIIIALLAALGWALWWRTAKTPAQNQPTTNNTTTTPGQTNQPSESPVRLSDPKPNDTIDSPLIVRGEARGQWFFEASFPIRLLDADGRELAVSHVQAQSDWMTENFVPFEGKLIFTPPITATGTLVLQKDNPSGLPQFDEEIKIPIRFKEVAEPMTVKVFFSNSQKDPEATDCNNVFIVERQVPKTTAAGRAALEELLKGPSQPEKGQGYTTSINPGVTIQSLTITNKTARADFNQALQESVGGSCRVTALRAQITETLKQFTTVNNVIISIDGKTQDILQP